MVGGWLHLVMGMIVKACVDRGAVAVIIIDSTMNATDLILGILGGMTAMSAERIMERVSRRLEAVGALWHDHGRGRNWQLAVIE